MPSHDIAPYTKVRALLIDCILKPNAIKMCTRQAADAGISFLVGFETEFILLKSTNPIEAVNDHPWSISAALSTGLVETTVLEEIADALKIAGIELQMYHAEAAPGQVSTLIAPKQR